MKALGALLLLLALVSLSLIGAGFLAHLAVDLVAYGWGKA